MPEVTKLGPAKRLGARYGIRVRYKLDKVEREQRQLHKCPYCKQKKVKRLVMGIYQCRKCKAKFTGKAYTIAKKIIIKEEIVKKEPLPKQ